uniref:Transcriptional regulator n=1 Tax=Haemonchus placei TaxID=6290 RepID=A0A0N4WC40_HAEPC
LQLFFKIGHTIEFLQAELLNNVVAELDEYRSAV